MPLAYSTAYQDALAIIEKYERHGADPRLLSEKVSKILDHPRPRLHYQVGKFGQRISILLKRMLPGRVMERLMANYYQCWE